MITIASIRKLAALRIALDGITSKRRNAYRSHHASSEPTDLATLKSIYVELAALRSYCDLNQTGFYKIIKKYDKIMEVRAKFLVSNPQIDIDCAAAFVANHLLLFVVFLLVLDPYLIYVPRNNVSFCHNCRRKLSRFG